MRSATAVMSASVSGGTGGFKRLPLAVAAGYCGAARPDDTAGSRALPIRQPGAELILRGIKTVQYRSRATRIVGERFHLYAAGKWRPGRPRPAAVAVGAGGTAWSLDLAAPAGGGVPPWMAELAAGLRLFPGDLPTGGIVGSAVIEQVTRGDHGLYQWHLADVRKAKRFRNPTGHPQPVWFEPFKAA